MWMRYACRYFCWCCCCCRCYFILLKLLFRSAVCFVLFRTSLYCCFVSAFTCIHFFLLLCCLLFFCLSFTKFFRIFFLSLHLFSPSENLNHFQSRSTCIVIVLFPFFCSISISSYINIASVISVSTIIYNKRCIYKYFDFLLCVLQVEICLANVLCLGLGTLYYLKNEKLQKCCCFPFVSHRVH